MTPLEQWNLPYVELASDHAFSAFLAGLTPSMVLKDRSAMLSKPERQRQRFLKSKGDLEYQIFLARALAATA